MDGDGLVVAGAVAGEVVAGVLDGAVENGELAEEAVVDLLAVGAVGDDGGVQVDGLAAERGLPAQAHPDRTEQRVAALDQRDRLVLPQADPALVQIDLPGGGRRRSGRGHRGSDARRRGQRGRGAGRRFPLPGGRRHGSALRRGGGRGGRRGRCRQGRGGRGRRCGCRRFLDADAEVGGDTGEPVGVPLADGADLPGAVAAVDLDDDQRGLRAEPGRGEGGEDGAAVRVAHGAGRLRTGEGGAGGVRARGDDDLLDVRGDRRGVDGDGVAATGCPGTVGHPGAAAGLVVEDEVGVGAHLACGGEQQARDVQPHGGGDVHRHPSGAEREIRARSHCGHASSNERLAFAVPLPAPSGGGRFRVPRRTGSGEAAVQRRSRELPKSSR